MVCGEMSKKKLLKVEIRLFNFTNTRTSNERKKKCGLERKENEIRRKKLSS